MPHRIIQGGSMTARAHVSPVPRVVPAVLAVALLGLSVGCASLTGGPASSERAAQGLSEARLARIAPVMQDQIQRGMFPGAVTLVARNGKVVHFEAHGHLDEAKTRPMQKDTLFRLASMTKPIVTTAAMML